MHGGDNDDNNNQLHLRGSNGDTLDLRNLKVISAVGRGAKGVVFLARTYDASNGKWLALKVISKDLLQKKNNGECKRVSFEQHILRRFDHPLLPRLRGVFETEKLIGFAIDYCHGGNLHSLRKRQSEKMFSEEAIRFYAVELVLALEYLHNFGVVYRDLKPENIMIQETGHIMLVDFDLSKKLNPKSPNSLSCNSSPGSDSVAEKDRNKRRFSRFYCYCQSGISPNDSESQVDTNSARRSESDSVEKSNSFVGTEDYVAPEVILGEGHNFGVDWWSFGVVLYEMLYGTTPFKGANRKETFCRILTREPDLTGKTTPLRDLIKKLLVKDPDRRIEVEEIKRHDFFRGANWDTVLQITRPPYIPQNDVEDKVGFSRKDVECFVHKIFFPDNNGTEEKSNELGKKDGNEKSDNNNKNAWVDKHEDKQFGKFLGLLKQLYINIPLVEALELCLPQRLKKQDEDKQFGKFLGRLKSLTVALTKESCKYLTKIPPKLKELGIFTLPFTIGKTYQGRALCDLGLSVNLMPTSIFKQQARPTTITLQLADRSIAKPEGKIEDVLVQV
ncbi:serine/threonine-protein kinase OXI1-like [Gastrolobium bilobum]|uniref:serine/threonine-protein kinase OXI1-like n=1 Tax=Gastrolobium bilobum TaxID=150636 RepID=UPI002AB0E053|nr:serine/threonine-protein kinase OXI1-like [Gastrolobium bilobum]